MNRWIATFALLLSACAPAPARIDSPALPALAHAGLLADVDVREHACESLHPGLYRDNTSAQLDAHFAKLRRALDHDQSLAAAHLAFSPFAAMIHCSHTSASRGVELCATRSAADRPVFPRWATGRGR